MGLVLVNAHLFRPAVALKVMRPRVAGCRSAFRRLADEGLASTFVRNTFQSVPFTCRFDADSWPVRCGADIEPCTLPWKLAELAKSSGCGVLPGVGVLNMPAMVATSRRSRASSRIARLDRLLIVPFIVRLVCGVRT